jgi:A/G-specific adenine glycosylase
MLQQTQVDRVIGYWERFLSRFPTVEVLARATLPEVLSLWKGLGYYSRARNLHRAAQAIVEQFGGQLPGSVEALRSLPGFGPYTAGAVASIAFGLAAPLVDGNVARVLARLLEIDGAPGERVREQALWAAAGALVEGPRPGDFNQALMELGATICVPANALCLLCPVRAACGALAHGRVDELPPPKKAGPRKSLAFAVAVCRRKKTVLLARRREGGLFGGLWELPSVELGAGQAGATALEATFGRSATIGPEMSVLERTLTHRDLSLHLHPVSIARLPALPAGYLEWRFVEPSEVAALGMSSAMTHALVEAGIGT